MAGVITYECLQCGCKIIVSGANESDLRPVYCCGIEIAKTSPSTQTDANKIKRKTRSKALIKADSGTAKRKTVKKVSVARSSSGR